MEIEISVPAKINLWLEVLRKRSDGYHDLSSLMLPVSVFDRITIDLREVGGFEAICSHPGVPGDERNLAVRAAIAYGESAGVRTGGVIRIEKEIPVGAGLGGGSADAAGVLLALNSHFNQAVAPGDLEKIAAGLGADVPFFLHRRPALATGIGEKLEFEEGVPQYALVLIKPAMSVSTAWVYRNLKLTRGESKIKLNTFRDSPWLLGGVAENDLESVTLPRHPVLARIKNWLLARGAVVALMSGSGPTVFGVFESENEAQLTADVAIGQWIGCWVRAARVLA